MSVLLYRRRLDLRSGAGQLIRAQATALRAAGVGVRLACQRGAVDFLLRTGMPVRRVSPIGTEALCAGTDFVVDHGAELPHADMLFVHNLLSESRRHCDDDVEDAVIKEADHFRRLDSEALIVANSHCVRAALIRDHDLNPDRVVVHYPGIESERFDHQRTFTLRHTARSRLRLAIDAPVIGFVTSGSLYKRGLDIFLSAAERIAASRNDARFLVVGSTALPDWAAAHPLFAEGRAFHRPRSGRPELWIAALDVFLYPARFEEFGMVVAEALALGVPIVTSRRVGATECMPAEYDPWLLDRPQGAGLADKALSLLDDDTARRRLARAGSASAAALDRQRYGHATSATILERAAEIGKAGRFA